MVGVADDSDDRGPVFGLRVLREGDAFADSTLAGPEPAGEGLVDHHDRRSLGTVLRAEVASLQDRDTDSLEITRSDKSIDREDRGVIGLDRLPLGDKADAATVLVERQPARA